MYWQKWILSERSLFYHNLQGVFEDYQQPFAVTFLGTSLLVAYLPIAFLKDRVLQIVNRHRSSKSSIKASSNTPTKQPDLAATNCIMQSVVIEMANQESNKNGEDILKEETQLDMKQIAKVALIIAPIWFVSEVINSAGKNVTATVSLRC